MKTWARGTYIGDKFDVHGHSLKGQKALLLCNDLTSIVKAQFDEVATGYGHGWHEFASEEWKFEKEFEERESDGETI